MRFLNVFSYFIYRIIRILFCNLQSLFCKNLPPKRCQISKILYRRKIDILDFERECDFVCLIDSIKDSTVLLSPNWSPYSFDLKFAYFVQLPEAVYSYNARNTPFLFIIQFEKAQKLAKIRLEDFFQLTNNLIGFDSKLVYVDHVSRCGSTLLAQMLHVSGKTISLSEPAGLPLISILKSEGKLTGNQLEMTVQSYLRYLARNLADNQILILKARVISSRLIPVISKMLPGVKFLFMHRKDTMKNVQSICRAALSAGLNQTALRLSHSLLLKNMACWFCCFLRYEREIIVSKTIYTYSYSIHQIALGFYKQYREQCKITAVIYEDLMENTEKELTKIFAFCGINDHYLNDAVKCLDSDSQRGSCLSQQVLSQIETSQQSFKIEEFQEITTEIRSKIAKISD